MSKEQFMTLVTHTQGSRIAALAVVRGEAKAEVVRSALDGQGLGGLEEQAAGSLKELQEVADRFGMGVGTLARAMLTDKLTLADLVQRTRYPRKRTAVPSKA